ncbi:hypothetical protein HK405_014400, partial [Cladochytrium tenue]
TVSVFVVRHGESVANAAGRICADPAAGTRPEEGLTPNGRRQARRAACRFVSAVLRLPLLDQDDDDEIDDHGRDSEHDSNRQVSGGAGLIAPAAATDDDDGAATSVPTPVLVLIASDFARARETAEVWARVLRPLHRRGLLYLSTPAPDDSVAAAALADTASATAAVRLDARLRERNFGPVLEGAPVARYDDAWAADARREQLQGVESPPAVLARARAAALAAAALAEAEAEVARRAGAQRAASDDDAAANTAADTGATPAPPPPAAVALLFAHGDTLQILLAPPAPAWDHRVAVPHMVQAEFRELSLAPLLLLQDADAPLPP